MGLCSLYIDANSGSLCERIDSYTRVSVAHSPLPLWNILEPASLDCGEHTVGKHKLQEVFCQGAH